MIKILYLILFYLIYRITDVILLLVLLVQTILNIFSGEPSQSIKEFGKSLGVYLQQISEFLSYASDEKPFPFSDWPVVRLDKNDQTFAAGVTPETAVKTQAESTRLAVNTATESQGAEPKEPENKKTESIQSKQKNDGKADTAESAVKPLTSRQAKPKAAKKAPVKSKEPENQLPTSDSSSNTTATATEKKDKEK